MLSRGLLLLCWFFGLTQTALAQADDVPPGDENPVLRVKSGGPTSLVTSLAFSPDGKTLYAGGWDKVVHVWKFQEGRWLPQPAFRVPLGPGNDGRINALSLW